MNLAHIKMRLANKGRGSFRAEGNTIWLYDAIASNQEEADWFGGVAPETFIAQLSAMSGDVTLRINSPGGSVFGAQAMVAAMRQHNGKITAQVDSLAASAASVIAVSCAECQMAPGSMMMIHKAWGMTVGNSEDMRATADLLDKIDGQIAAAYAKKCAKNATDMLALMADETWMTAEEAMAAGFADAVIETNTQAKAKWDLSIYAKAPKIAAAVQVTGYNDADVAFVTTAIGIKESGLAAAKAVIAAGQDAEVIGMAGECIAEATEDLSELNEWLMERGLPASADAAPMTEDRIDQDEDRQRRMRMAEALILTTPI